MIVEALELPGVMTYGETPEEAVSNAEKLAIEVKPIGSGMPN